MWIVCAYFTKNTSYEEHVKNLVNSLEQFNLPHEITSVDNRGNWYANTQYKPTFLKQMLEKHYPYSVIYVDADAIFCRYPEYFNKLDQEQNVDIAVYILDHSRYQRKNRAPEMLSGTIFLKNTATTKQIVEEWIQECRKDPKIWDQRALDAVLKHHRYHLLPEEYCTIFDYMASVKNPVIKHFQASRESRSRKGGSGNRKPRQNVSTSKPRRRVVQNGIVRIRRANLK